MRDGRLGVGTVEPFYDRGGIAIFNGDCRAILPALFGEVGPTHSFLLLTDPPYGVNLNTKYKSAKRSRLAEANDYPPVFGDDKPFDPAHLLAFHNVCMWGAQYYADKLPAMGRWFVWDKRDGLTPNDQADCELAWTRGGVTGTVPRLFRYAWMGMIKAGERDTRRCHPTQKPVELMMWCMKFFPGCDTIVDPYMGSGSTLRAAKDLGLRAIGIEVSKEYCEIAAARLAQEVLL